MIQQIHEETSTSYEMVGTTSELANNSFEKKPHNPNSGSTSSRNPPKVLRRSTTTQMSSNHQIRIIAKASELMVQPRRRNLRALSGLRTLATLWIVLGHFQQTAFAFSSDTFVLVLGRGFIPVAMYIALSGFVTHFAYQKKCYNNLNEIVTFFFRRMARVLFTYFASVLLGLFDPLFTRHKANASEYPEQAVATVFLVQSWFELPKNYDWQRSVPSQPNPGGWTISTLVFAWLLYPILNTGMKMFNRATGDKVLHKLALATLAYIFAMLPCFIIFIDGGGTMNNGEFELLYKFPPLRLADFFFGVVLSELVENDVVNSFENLWRWLPDFATLAFSLIVLLVDLNGTSPVARINAEAFFISGLVPLLGVMLLGFSINSGKPIKWSLSALLEHPVFIELGNWSFAVYCFQFTFFFMFEQWQFSQTGLDELEDGEMKLVAPFLLPYLLTLYVFSAVWTEVLEKRFAKHVKTFTSKRFQTGNEDVARKLVVPESKMEKKLSSRLEMSSFFSNGSQRTSKQDNNSTLPPLIKARLTSGRSLRGLVEKKATTEEDLDVVHEDDSIDISPQGSVKSGSILDAEGADAEVESSGEGKKFAIDIAIEDDEPKYNYDSDPDYENRQDSNYDFIPDTDSEGEVELNEKAVNVVQGIIDSTVVMDESNFAQVMDM